uniref:Uncharacterized protein n=1 Tax=viral metagenome TaxID=1070528 RepID=A0A6C0KZN2_9ZZZZ|tara:strand:- start:668 stop:1045 length:378 start_codon:yes stop_codon:yes gene_type:complete
MNTTCSDDIWETAISHEWNHPCLRRKKKTWNSCEKEKVQGFLSIEKVKKYKEESSEIPKQFLKFIYEDEEYKRWCKGKNVKRGANAKNWKNEGKRSTDFLCPTLHYVDNVYITMSKRVSKKKKSG